MILYFDTLANLVKQVGYGKIHNADLRVLDYVTINKFVDTNKVETISYQTDYENNLSAEYKTKYCYDDKFHLVKEQELYYKSDSLFSQFDYEYDSLGNQIKTAFSPTYYYYRIFDKYHRLISLQQIHEGKLRWEYAYTYSDTLRLGIFKTHYNDGKDYTKQETRIFHDGALIQVEEKYVHREGLATLTKLLYDNRGYISRIEYYNAYDSTFNYKLECYTDIKIRSKYALNRRLVNKVNAAIFDQ